MRLENGENVVLSHDEAERLGKQAAEKAVAWLKQILFWMVAVAVLLPSLGVTAVLFAWAYSLVK